LGKNSMSHDIRHACELLDGKEAYQYGRIVHYISLKCLAFCLVDLGSNS